MSRIDFDKLAEAVTPEQLAEAIGAPASRSPGKFHCPSPAHESGDKRPSLSINRKDGRTLAYCHGCGLKGTPVQVAAKLWGVSHDDAAERLVSAAGIARPNGGQREILNRYEYTDESGKHLFEVVRFKPKDFRQRVKQGSGWTWKLGDTRRVLYRLPEVVAKVEKKGIVMICEGEKDADALSALGFVATCNSGGAGKWRKEYSESLRGTPVVIFPDNDEQGRKHGQIVAQGLHGIASEIRILELPGLPRKGDASDWFEDGGTAAELKQLVKACPIWDPSTTAAEPEDTEGADADSTLSLKEILKESGILDLDENPEMEDVVTVMQKLQRLVSGVDQGGSSLIRGGAIEALKKAKVRAPAKVVDGYFSAKRSELQPEPEPPPDEAYLLRVGSPVLETKDPLGLIRSRAKEARYAGNTSALELLVLVIASRILDTPINALLKGPSAGGKSYTVECALQFHPPEAVYLLTASSERALIYSDEDFQHRHIVIAEASGMQPDGVAATIMRELCWGGRGIRYETVEKVEGEMRSRLIEKEGPTGLITTSTGPLNKEMATRLLTITIDDSPEQTKEILESLGAEAEDGGGSLWEKLDFSDFHAAFRWMFHYGACAVKVPYGRRLARMVTRGDVRLRRDFTQILAVIEVSALISQRHRQLTADGKVEANLEDYRVAHRLLSSVLAISMDQVSPVIRKTVEQIAAAVKDHSEDFGISGADLVKLMKLPKQTINYRVTQARMAGFLVNLETRKGYRAKLRPAESLPDDRAVIPTPEELQGSIPFQEPPENDWDIGTPPPEAAPVLDEQPSQDLSQRGSRPNGTDERSDTYSDTPLSSNEATKRQGVPMSQRNPGVSGEGISPPPNMDLWTGEPTEEDGPTEPEEIETSSESEKDEPDHSDTRSVEERMLDL